MLLIATDEAGYGPKLGPLVIAATVWDVPDDWKHEQLHAAFASLRHPVALGDDVVTVNDSKAVYQPSAGLNTLHIAVSASLAWCGIEADNLSKTLPIVCPHDVEAIRSTPWLKVDPSLAMRQRHEMTSLLDVWTACEVQLLDVQTRIISAREFNRACSNGSNKADLLSQSTLNLMREVWHRHASDHSETLVYCDRHGGRRYYAGVLQHVIPEAWIHIESEAARQSVYRAEMEDHTMRVHFTVKGDSFTPVALASMHAKYWRERMMEAFNQYFRNLVGDSLKPTAGYPVDADRFLEDIEPTLQHHKIDRESLVRCR